MKLIITLFFSLAFVFFSNAQDTIFKSIHQMESEFYRAHPLSLIQEQNKSHPNKALGTQQFSPLQKRVFGYHPYWAGNDYLNYQWDLLSDLCYFSYEVDPSTGLPLTTHDWESSPAIDSALAHGTHVHLCVTLFSGHASFFTNPDAQQTLISQIILMLQQRNAQGVNMDIEALPSAYSEAFTNFMIHLSTQMDSLIPDAELSIAAPAVNWSNKFNIPVLNNYIDFFMVMGYDYYWPGSSQAGASSPTYPMVGNYTYCFSRTISYYQSQGVPNEKIVMGVPYYAYQWPTQTGTAPSYTTGSGNAYTYSNIHNNPSGNYSFANKHREPNSFSAYYAFQNGGWFQCFIEDEYSLSEKYQTVNRRNLGGIGIWALGYDDGYSELWNLIGQYFTSAGPVVSPDTIFDSGGPGFDYFDDEMYSYTISSPGNSPLYLKFTTLNLEQGYDTLWVYDGPDTSAIVLAIFSGDTLPSLIGSSSNSLTLRFYSDGATTNPGWVAIFDTTQISAIQKNQLRLNRFSIYPNPVGQGFNILINDSNHDNYTLIITNSLGKLIIKKTLSSAITTCYIPTPEWKAGLYTASLFLRGERISGLKFIKE